MGAGQHEKRRQERLCPDLTRTHHLGNGKYLDDRFGLVDMPNLGICQ